MSFRCLLPHVARRAHHSLLRDGSSAWHPAAAQGRGAESAHWSHYLLTGTFQEDGSRGHYRPLGRPDFHRRSPRQLSGIFPRVGHGHLLHASDILRFFRLFRHGDWCGAHAGTCASPEFFLSFTFYQHLGVMAQMAHDAQPLCACVHLTSRCPFRSRGLPPSKDYGKWTTMAVSVFLPAFLSMLIIGAWHGPNWTYVLFGAMQGAFIITDEIHTALTRKRRRKKPDTRAAVFCYGLLTLLAFAAAAVPFRSETIERCLPHLWRNGRLAWPGPCPRTGPPSSLQTATA